MIESMIYPEVDATVMVDYTSLRDRLTNESTGKVESIIVVPLDSRIAEVTTEKLRAYENTTVFGMGSDTETFEAVIPRSMVSAEMITAIQDQYLEEQSEYMFPTEMFPNDQESAYMEAGFTTRVYKTEDYMKIMNIAIVLAMVFLYSFVVLLMLIGLTSIISTMSTNVRMRSREFAVLQSVGMTESGLKRMLHFESIICSSKSLIIGLPIAITLTYLVNLPIRSMFPVLYQFPWLAIFWCITGVFVITWVTMHHATKGLRDKSIVETIRLESGV